MKPRARSMTTDAGVRLEDRSLVRLREAMFDGIEPIAPGAERGPALRERLIGRVRESIAANAVFRTVREIDEAWVAGDRGVRHKTLNAGTASRSHLLELDAGAVLSPRSLDAAEEWLVLDGRLRVEPPGGPTIDLPAGAYLLLAAGQALDRTTAIGRTRWYRRIVDAGHPALPAAEAAWVPAAGSAPRVVLPSDDGWAPLREGVSIKPLSGTPDGISLLARFEPGAVIPAHGHDIDEECVMLDGDLFLGDVLLRRGEFQLAPAGTRHEPLVSDVGCVLFFHGAIDPSLR